ncbi:hypothetical protein J9253_16945 [Thiothrix litoralis]|jgi:hypothetical protein|uniref:Uncharacterized protein n=1 Tax=Thiothrix litoralis TaxID=2891210 RepID=A0ABX7WR26_9GAMM|nr:hypothetical protein [Thiothrix litoralis]QTR45672.1 hypothetical protein J9253_16945 [Thiothrix litoralis]
MKRLGFAILSLLPLTLVQAELKYNSAGPTEAVSASVSLDFEINIGKFIFLRVGTGAYPTASNTVDTVAINTALQIPGVASPLSNGNGVAVNWAGDVPTLTASSAVLPVEVRSNAGQVSLRATVNTPLSNGAVTIPFSRIAVTSSDSGLPAPLIPDTGSGAGVNVTGTSFDGLITERSANWTFTYTGGVIPAAGIYNGEVGFTASAP